MHSINRVGFRDPGLQDSSVRRYNVDFCQVQRSPESVIQDGSGNLRLYVVARRNSVANLQSYMPYDMFTHANDWLNIEEASSLAGDDIFDRGISSSEDDRSPYSVRGASPLVVSQASNGSQTSHRSINRSVSPQSFASEISAKRLGTSQNQSPSPVQAVNQAVGVDLQPQDEGPAYDYTSGLDTSDYHGMSPEVVLSRSPGSRNVSFAKAVLSTSPKPRPKRTLSGASTVERLSPTGYSPFASFGAVYSSGLDHETTQDISAATANTLATIESLKKGRVRRPKKSTLAVSEALGSIAKRAKTNRVKEQSGGPLTVRSTDLLSQRLHTPTPDTDMIEMRIGHVSDVELSGKHGSLQLRPYTDGSPKAFGGVAILEGPMEVSELRTIEPPHRKGRKSKDGKRSVKTVADKEPSPASGMGTLVTKRGRTPKIADSGSIDDHSTRSDQGVQTHVIEHNRPSLGAGGDEFDMDEYGSFSTRVRNGQLGLGVGRKPSPPHHKRAKNVVNSAMLLNSWYISYGDERKSHKRSYEHVEPYVGRNRRYPTRSRLPPIQHWNSNMTPDGSSVWFLIGVTSDDKKMGVRAQHASGDVLILNEDSNTGDESSSVVRIHVEEMPESSLVLTDSHGVMEMQVIETSSDRPLAIANKPRNTARRSSVSLTMVKKRSAVVDKSDKGPSKPLAIEGRPSASKGKASGTKQKKKAVSRKRKEMSVQEALEIIKLDSIDSLGAEEPTDNPAVDGSPHARRHTDFYQEMSFHPARRGIFDTLHPDSVTMQDNKQISYRSFFRVGEVESQLYNGSIFQPMIMNSRCRSSNVIIPIGRHVDMGNVKANFICGYLYSGENVVIRGLGISYALKHKHTFFLPMFEEWAIHNESPNMDANIALTFVSI
ncbi:hypothetical protein X943_000222 [Babesia divergens]|uniref:Uncharacterized protein n=1 Tax=Babesia divergens TaxID=32595 RepID=A0AAD9GH19_BABDI|nr:hypothetical protein X943_000222 [Babesia divergens]